MPRVSRPLTRRVGRAIDQMVYRPVHATVSCRKSERFGAPPTWRRLDGDEGTPESPVGGVNATVRLGLPCVCAFFDAISTSVFLLCEDLYRAAVAQGLIRLVDSGKRSSATGKSWRTIPLPK